MFLRVSTVLLAIAALGFADTLTLRSGEVVRGQYLGGDARHVKMAVGDRVDTYSIDDVSDLAFGGPQRQSFEGRRNDRPDDRRDDRRDNGLRDAPSADQPAVNGMVIPAGTPITVRMIDRVDSEETRLGQTFRASVDEPVLLDGQVAIPRGADATVKLVEDQQSGKIQGRTILTLVLQEVIVNGRPVDLTSSDVSQSSGSRGARSAKVIGGTAALGAIIGAIAGGGKGAAIGAGSGAAVGTGVQVLTKGQTVKIPSETRLTFTLQQPAQL